MNRIYFHVLIDKMWAMNVVEMRELQSACKYVLHLSVPFLPVRFNYSQVMRTLINELHEIPV